MSGNRTLYHAIQAGESSHGCHVIPVTISSLTSAHLTPQTSAPLIIMCGVQEFERMYSRGRLQLIINR